MTTFLPSTRVAAAPISWGLCEVPGWGFQLTPERVLDEIGGLGLVATEFGPPGFLPEDPHARRAQLKGAGLRGIGGFLPVLLHDHDHDPLSDVDAFVDDCLVVGAGIVVLAAFTGTEGYDDRPVLDEQGWSRLLGNLDRIHDHVAGRGLVAALHPHIGTMVEQGEEVQRVLDGSRVGLCLDTGHLAAAGADPVAIAAGAPDRVRHVHLKDVDLTMAREVVDGGRTFGDAVRDGLFRPLGRGDVAVRELVELLEAAGYDGWYVLEQDVKLAGEPTGRGPVEDVETCLSFLTGPEASAP